MHCVLPLLGSMQGCQEGVEAGHVGDKPCCLHHGPPSIGLLALPQLRAASHNPGQAPSIQGQTLYMGTQAGISACEWERYWWCLEILAEVL